MIASEELVGARTEARQEIVLAGVGGQGLVYSGGVLGRAAVRAGHYVVQTQSYGVASRGGFTKAEVVLADEPIAYPMVTNPDAVLTLSDGAYRRYSESLAPQAVLVYDSDAIDREGGSRGRGFPLTSMARKMGLMASHNLMALGVLVKETSVVPRDSIVALLEEQSDTSRGEANLRAFSRGLELSATD